MFSDFTPLQKTSQELELEKQTENMNKVFIAQLVEQNNYTKLESNIFCSADFYFDPKTNFTFRNDWGTRNFTRFHN